jgi:hypothetical protein
MKTDKELFEDLKVFAKKFINDYNLCSYDVNGYFNALGDLDINEDDWDNSEALREEFEAWLSENNLETSDQQIEVSFIKPSIKIFGLITTIE